MSYEEETFFQTFFNFVHDRLFILDAEIENEEKNKPVGETCIMVEILKKRISFNGNSESLREKMKGCFSEHDDKALALRFEEAYSFLN